MRGGTWSGHHEQSRGEESHDSLGTPLRKGGLEAAIRQDELGHAAVTVPPGLSDNGLFLSYTAGQAGTLLCAVRVRVIGLLPGLSTPTMGGDQKKK